MFWLEFAKALRPLGERVAHFYFWFGEEVAGGYAEGIGYAEQLVNADVADAVFHFREVSLVDVRHEGKLFLGDVLSLTRLHDALPKLPSFVEIIHTVKAI